MANQPLAAAAASKLVRGPYLQNAGPDRITLRWRTADPTTGRVRFGPAPGQLTGLVTEATATAEHEVVLTGLKPATAYCYAIGDAAGDLAGGDAAHAFKTAPAIGAGVPVRIWAIGDAGTQDDNQRAVYQSYQRHVASKHTDVLLMLGDNAYTKATDGDYQKAVFEMYADLLQATPVWSCLGNHENDYGGRDNFFKIFSFPEKAKTDGISSGVDSGSESYYSFDFGPVHFVCLDSASNQDYTTAGAMYRWVDRDLEQTAAKWLVAFWHHPPYTKGSHDSDKEGRLKEMRSVFLPLLEKHGVDLVLCGHSHCYERSGFIDGHYGQSDTFKSSLKAQGGQVVQAGRGDAKAPYQKPGGLTPHAGTVYVVDGSSGKTSGGKLNHPAMAISLNVLGSVMIEVAGGDLKAEFIDNAGSVRDVFVIHKAESQKK